MDEPQMPPGPWAWRRVVSPPSELVRPEARGKPHADALVAKDGTVLIAGDGGHASLSIHPAVKDLLADAWTLRTRLQLVEDQAERLSHEVNELRLELRNRDALGD